MAAWSSAFSQENVRVTQPFRALLRQGGEEYYFVIAVVGKNIVENRRKGLREKGYRLHRGCGENDEVFHRGEAGKK